VTDDTTTPIEGEAVPANDEQRQVLEASEVLPAETVEAIEEGERELAESTTLQSLRTFDRKGEQRPEVDSRPTFILSEVDTNHPNGSIVLAWDTCGECHSHIQRCECPNGPHRPRYVDTWFQKNEEANRRLAEQKAERAARAARVEADPDVVAASVAATLEERTPSGRKVRSDKGKPRGPRVKRENATPETVLEAAGDLSAAMKDS